MQIRNLRILVFCKVSLRKMRLSLNGRSNNSLSIDPKQCKIDARKSDAPMMQRTPNMIPNRPEMQPLEFKINLSSNPKWMSKNGRIKMDPWWSKSRSKAKGWSSTGVYGRGPRTWEGGKGEGKSFSEGLKPEDNNRQGTSAQRASGI